MNNIKTFNTGRKYTAKGQRIAWMIRETLGGAQHVLFVDVDRMIDGHFVTALGVSESTVMRFYDHNRYQSGLWEYPEESKALTAAARAI